MSSFVSADFPTQTVALQWNMCGLKNNYHELSLLINLHKPLIICLQETMIPLVSFNLPGYDTIIVPDPDNTSHRGVGSCIRAGTPF